MVVFTQPRLSAAQQKWPRQTQKSTASRLRFHYQTLSASPNSLKEPQRIFAITNQQVFGLLVVVQGQFVGFAAYA